MFKRFPIIRQLDQMDCAPTCLLMICRFYGKSLRLSSLRQLCSKGQQGVTMHGLSVAAEEVGLKTLPLKLDIETFWQDACFPCIVHWNKNHFVVVQKIKNNKIYIADPAEGQLTLEKSEFNRFWSNDTGEGIALLLQPTQAFNEQEDEHSTSQNNGLKRLVSYLFRFRSFLGQLGLGALLGSLLNLIFPFLTQALVDHGINNHNIDFVYLIVIAQLVIFISRTATEFIRGWVLLHMGTRINIAVISDFLVKLTRLPLSYFSQKNLGDVLQRISDHSKIEEFLTAHSLSVLFSLFNLTVFSFILASYSSKIFLVFLLGSVASIIWVSLFLNKRKVLDYQQFDQLAANQNNVVQLVSGMPEIKLNQAQNSRRWEWENIQAKLFKIKLKCLAVEQYQTAGNLFLNEGKNILITFIAAQQVIQGQITLGMMMAITYILGQMNAPIEQLINFIRTAQDAKISMERLGEIQEIKDEKDEPGVPLSNRVPEGDLEIKELSFKYSRHDSVNVIDKLDLSLGYNKTTAIVGASGSGKTTLMKLLLKFHQVSEGKILVGGQNLSFICPDSWREKCGVVMQDGFIFSDSIANNIAMGCESVDFDRLIHAAKTANIHEEIERLPQSYQTRVGAEGLGLSGGQTQRLLIARAVYKSPDYLFFDEATSALDATNEKTIQDNLQYFFKGKTVVIIAHRLSTVKNADQIVVLDQGSVVEQGNHQSLSKKKGFYYSLVKNQLELGG